MGFLYPIATVVAQVTNAVLGWLMDKMQRKERIGGIGTLVIAFGLLCAAYMHTVEVAVLWAVLFGFMSGMGMLFYSTIFGVWFGKSNFGAIFGMAGTFGTFASGFAPAAVGLMKEAAGEYKSVFEYLCVAAFAISALMWSIKAPTTKPHCTGNPKGPVE